MYKPKVDKIYHGTYKSMCRGDLSRYWTPSGYIGTTIMGYVKGARWWGVFKICYLQGLGESYIRGLSMIDPLRRRQ